jgi:hypothetical protein
MCSNRTLQVEFIFDVVVHSLSILNNVFGSGGACGIVVPSVVPNTHVDSILKVEVDPFTLEVEVFDISSVWKANNDSGAPSQGFHFLILVITEHTRENVGIQNSFLSSELLLVPGRNSHVPCMELAL